MNFIGALVAMQEGKRVARIKWGKKAVVYIVNNTRNNISHVEVRTLGNCIMYAASSEDLLAEDWCLLEDINKPKEEMIL